MITISVHYELLVFPYYSLYSILNWVSVYGIFLLLTISNKILRFFFPVCQNERFPERERYFQMPSEIDFINSYFYGARISVELHKSLYSVQIQEKKE